MTGREAILSCLRQALGRGAVATIPKRGPHLIPARSRLSGSERVDLFIEMANEAKAQLTRLSRLQDVAEAAAGYLSAHSLPARLRVAPDPLLAEIFWERTLLQISKGPARGEDQASLTAAFAGIAETGTLLLLSGSESPTTLNFLPDTHMVVLRQSQIVGSYEDAWALLRGRGSEMPRTVNMITGPSRTGDIEQTILMGAHGPRRVHIFLVNDGQPR